MQSMARDETMRARLAELVAAVDDGEVDGEARPSCSSRCSSSDCRRAAIRAYYGPGGEQAALVDAAEAAARPRCAPTAPAMSRPRCRRSPARRIDAVKIAAVAPGAFTLAIEADGVQASVRLDANGARLTSLAHMSDPRYYMACLDLRGRDCLVVGGGRVATEKVHGPARLRGARHRRRAARRRSSFAVCRCAIERREFQRADVDGRLARDRGDERPRGQRSGVACCSRANPRSATSPTTRSSAASSSRRSCAATRSSSVSRPAARRRRSRNAFAPTSRSLVGPEHAELARRLARAAAVGETRAADLRRSP